MKLCKYCNTYNDNNSLFCEKCGAKFPKKKITTSKIKLATISALIIIGIICASNMFSQYNRYIRQSSNYAKTGEYPAAASALEHAIQLDSKNPKAYIKKAELYSNLVDDNTVRLIYTNLENGYKNTKSNKIIKAFEKHIKKLDSSGQSDMAMGLKRLAYEGTYNKCFKKDYENINEKIISAYSDILKLNKSKEAFYIVYDIDKNGIPELITGHYGMYFSRICTAYTFNNDTAVNIGDFTSYDYCYSGGICSYPNTNGIFLLNTSNSSSEVTEWTEVLSISNLKLVLSSETDEKIINSNKNLHTPEFFISDSQILATYDINSIVGLYSSIKLYESVYDAYKDILEISSAEKYTTYKIDNDTIPELITMNEVKNKNFSWKTLSCNVYSMLDGRIKILGKISADEKLYTDKYDNLIYKNIYITNDTDYSYILIEEDELKINTFLRCSSYTDNDVEYKEYKYNNNTISESEYYEKESEFNELTTISKTDDFKLLENIKK